MKTVIVGAGQAGAWVARTLRQHAPEAQIVLVGQEPHPPYERPPLSKGVMSGAQSEPPCLLPVQQAGELGIRLELGTRAVAIDRARRQVLLEQGPPLAYDTLVLATGGAARQPNIPGGSLPGVHTLRSLDDAVRLRGALQPGRRLLVVGGGWIGLEVAATARLLGLQVCLIEGGSRLCARSVPADISNFLLDLHRRHGVDVQLKGAVIAIEPAADDGALRVRTHRGVELADVVVFGIGLKPNTELAVACGLQVENGIVVDARGQTSDPAIYAVGDVANQPCGWPGAQLRLRLESWANAQGQGIAVGAALAGKPAVPQDLPWFWSDQYDVNLQVLGIPSEAGLRVVRGSMREAKFCVFQIVEETLHSVVAVNMAKELKLAKRWHKQGRCPSTAELQNPDTRLERI
ncbi:NAD(P)/FAD-dependent oxidoreductase [Bordetella petrii]|uniref:NAD(P)/FAD-dependent oxidoreductase n=1 Tax=Bordetella petrii TaxID=94624 RepID=UPI001E30C204|nr:FAD-dependent oxidoreductase [Bordetella petrii]MCD0502581.1 FAD-dependent oxidoreductase [Bordetella petrii]